MTRRIRAALWSLCSTLTVASCQRFGGGQRIVEAPRPSPPVAALSPDTTRRASSVGEPSSAVPVVRAEDVAKAVAAVFGDTSALHPSAGLLESSEPVWDMDVRSYETRERVLFYVNYFTTQAREYFQSRMTRGSRYQPMIHAKLRASGLPEDLTYLAMIESGYDPDAYSKAAAVGMWQFMSKTAREIGLRVDWWVDERRDPAKSTDGAIRFLGELQQQFGSLYLAAAAYNGGPGRVSRGLTQFASELEGSEGEDRFFVLAERNYLRPETKDYVPKLIAAALIGKQAARYAMSVDSLPEFAYDSLFVPAGTTVAAVAKASGGSERTVRELNPFVLRGMAPPDGGMWMRVPAGTGARADSMLLAMPPSSLSGFKTVSVTGSKSTLATLAKAHGLTVRQLSWYNPTPKVLKRGRLAAGQSVRIPTVAALAFARDIPDPAIERYGSPSVRRRTAARGRASLRSDARRSVVVRAANGAPAASAKGSSAKKRPSVKPSGSAGAKAPSVGTKRIAPAKKASVGRKGAVGVRKPTAARSGVAAAPNRPTVKKTSRPNAKATTKRPSSKPPTTKRAAAKAGTKKR